MRKFTFLKMMLLAVVMLAGSMGTLLAQGTEDFEAQTTLSTSYATSSFTNAASGITWSYANSRNEDTYGITGKGIMLRYADSYLEATLPSGFGKISFQYRKAFTGTIVRQLELLVNGVSVKTDPSFGTGTETTVYDFVYEVNTPGPATIRIKNVGTGTTNKQTVVDNIVWTGYSGSGNPTVATPSIEVTSGVAKTTDTYFNTAEVTLSSSTDGASIYYTLDGNDPTTSSTLYSAPFNLTTTKTIKALAVKAEMDDSGIASKTITIVAPATATVPYTEAFNNTLGDWYNYEVSGTKPWYPSVNGAVANGYGGGDVESWLISPKFTATGEGITLSFNYASKYIGNPISIKMSSDYTGFGNPSSATWTELTSIAAPTVQDNDYTVKASGDIVSATTGTVYFALVYDTDASYSDWRITNAAVNNYTAPTAPVLTISEITVPEMTAETGQTDSETINVSGVSLTSDIAISIEGTDASMFSVSPASIAQTAGSASGAVTVSYSPTAAGSHTATLTVSSTGAESVTRTLTGTATWAPLAAPVAIDETGVSQTGFTANWEAVSGATEYELNVFTKTDGGNASDLFISEYVEGSSYNKAIEIFNGTGSEVDLSNYSIMKQVNGAGEYGSELILSGTLANNDVYVIAYVSGTNSASTDILAVTDLQTNSSAINYNGNDAVALFKNSVQIDEVGVFNQVASWGADLTLVRKSTIVSPKATYDALDWDVNEKDYIANLGSHTMDASSVSPITGSPFIGITGTSQVVTGLSNANTYYYTVVAKNANVTSPVSNEIAVALTATGLTSTRTDAKARAYNGKVLFNATAGESVEIYNTVGQKLVSTTAVDGLNEVPVRATGVLVVKVSNRVSKVIL